MVIRNCRGKKGSLQDGRNEGALECASSYTWVEPPVKRLKMQSLKRSEEEEAEDAG